MTGGEFRRQAKVVTGGGMVRGWTRWAVGVVLWWVPASLFAAGPVEPAPFPLDKEFLAGSLREDSWDAAAPVDIQSEQMSVDFQKHEIVFEGAVRVRQADFVLTAKEVTAVFGNTAEDVRKIVARGDVMIRKGDKVARGQEAIYDRPESVIVLRGSPYLEQGRNFIQGECIRVYLQEDRMDIQGDVSAEFRVKGQPRPSDGAGSEKAP